MIRPRAKELDSLTSVFVCFTPYHLLLAETIVNQEQLNSVRLVVADEGGILDWHPTILPERLWAENIRLTPIGSANGYRRALIYRANVATLRGAFSREGLGAVYVFNPQRPEARYMLGLTAGERVFVEDGLEAYLPAQTLQWTKRVGRIATAVVAGVKPTLTTRYAAYAKWDRGLALLPEHVQGVEAAGFGITQINCNELGKVARNWSRRVDIPEGVFGAILLAPLRLTGPDGIAGDIDHAMTRTGLGSDRILVKTHPRDIVSPLYLEERGLAVADGKLPAEVLLQQIEFGGSVIGGDSTAVLTAALLRPDLRLVAPRKGRSKAFDQLLTKLIDLRPGRNASERSSNR